MGTGTAPFTRGDIARGDVESSPIAQIGPNAVSRALEAVHERFGPLAEGALRERVGLPDHFPDHLVPETWFVDLVQDLRGHFPPGQVGWVLAEAGERTGRYVTANRIPAPFRALLRMLPPRLALPILLDAFGRHAWTFAGSGRFRVEGRYPRSIVLEDAPTCRIPGPAYGSGTYYESAFQTLLSLAAPGIRVREVECTNRGHSACRFELSP